MKPTKSKKEKPKTVSAEDKAVRDLADTATDRIHSFQEEVKFLSERVLALDADVVTIKNQLKRLAETGSLNQ